MSTLLASGPGLRQRGVGAWLAGQSTRGKAAVIAV